MDPSPTAGNAASPIWPPSSAMPVATVPSQRHSRSSRARPHRCPGPGTSWSAATYRPFLDVVRAPTAHVNSPSIHARPFLPTAKGWASNAPDRNVCAASSQWQPNGPAARPPFSAAPSTRGPARPAVLANRHQRAFRAQFPPGGSHAWSKASARTAVELRHPRFDEPPV